MVTTDANVQLIERGVSTIDRFFSAIGYHELKPPEYFQVAR